MHDSQGGRAGRPATQQRKEETRWNEGLKDTQARNTEGGTRRAGTRATQGNGTRGGLHLLFLYLLLLCIERKAMNLRVYYACTASPFTHYTVSASEGENVGKR